MKGAIIYHTRSTMFGRCAVIWHDPMEFPSFKFSGARCWRACPDVCGQRLANAVLPVTAPPQLLAAALLKKAGIHLGRVIGISDGKIGSVDLIRLYHVPVDGAHGKYPSHCGATPYRSLVLVWLVRWYEYGIFSVTAKCDSGVYLRPSPVHTANSQFSPRKSTGGFSYLAGLRSTTAKCASSNFLASIYLSRQTNRIPRRT